MKRIVVGVFQDFSHAKAVVHDLASLGVPTDEVSLITRYTDEHHDLHGEETETVKDARTGALVGGLAGLLLGLSPLLIPGVGPALVGGWLFTTFAGATLGGITGGFAGALLDMGIHAQAAHSYTEQVAAGNTLVIVRVHSEQEAPVVELMQRDGAVDIHEAPVPTV